MTDLGCNDCMDEVGGVVCKAEQHVPSALVLVDLGEGRGNLLIDDVTLKSERKDRCHHRAGRWGSGQAISS